MNHCTCGVIHFSPSLLSLTSTHSFCHHCIWHQYCSLGKCASYVCTCCRYSFFTFFRHRFVPWKILRLFSLLLNGKLTTLFWLWLYESFPALLVKLGSWNIGLWVEYGTLKSGQRVQFGSLKCGSGVQCVSFIRRDLHAVVPTSQTVLGRTVPGSHFISIRAFVYCVHQVRGRSIRRKSSSMSKRSTDWKTKKMVLKFKLFCSFAYL